MAQGAEAMVAKLYRKPSGGMLAGVCAGLSDLLGVDVTLIRVVFLVGTFVSLGTLFRLIYLALWFLLPVR